MVGIIWQNLIRLSEERKTINNRQVGGRAGCNANTLTFTEELKNDTSCCSRRVLINFDNDVASCYKRIIPNLANLIGHKKGLHNNVTFVHANTLAEANFKLKTALSVSKDFYQHCTAFLIFGTGQGSTNSPMILLIISSTLFDIHENLGHRANFCDTLNEIQVHISTVGFVDDTASQANMFYDDVSTPEDILKLMQHDDQL
eukprot:1732835-Ditylum_brightwellii.AAC.1